MKEEVGALGQLAARLAQPHKGWRNSYHEMIQHKDAEQEELGLQKSVIFTLAKLFSSSLALAFCTISI